MSLQSLLEMSVFVYANIAVNNKPQISFHFIANINTSLSPFINSIKPHSYDH